MLTTFDLSAKFKTAAEPFKLAEIRRRQKFNEPDTKDPKIHESWCQGRGFGAIQILTFQQTNSS